MKDRPSTSRAHGVRKMEQDEFESDMLAEEREMDRKARDFRRLQEASIAIEQQLKDAPEKSAYDAWIRLTATPYLHVANALGDSAGSLRSWLDYCAFTVSDEAQGAAIVSNALVRLRSVFSDVACLYGWSL